MGFADKENAFLKPGDRTPCGACGHCNREELGASVLVIEHDMPFIMGISDRVYCLEAGRIIAEGVPDVVRNDVHVIASYLGTDERAIARSDAAKPVETPTP